MPIRPTGRIRHHQGTLNFLHRLIEALLVVLCLVVATWIYQVPWHDRYSFMAVSGVAVMMIFAGRYDLYRSWRIAAVQDELTRLWLAWIGTVFVLLLLAFALKTTVEYSRLVMGTWFVTTPIVLALWRFAFRIFLHELRRRGLNSRSVAIVGANELGTRLAQTINRASWMGLRLVGFFDDRRKKADRMDEWAQAQLLGNFELLLEMIRKNQVDIVYITFPLRAEPRVKELVARLSDSTVSVYFVPDFNVFDILHGRWMSMGDLPVVSIYESPHQGIDGWVKRAEDIVLASVLLLLLMLPMLMIAIAVKLSSPGPVLFKQRRYGINGQEIEVWKFRTMTVCEDGDDVAQATFDDPRVTRIGRFLRRTSLDELPQFFNVLQGNMSVVGPRPHAVAHNEIYRKLIHRYMLRHKVKPGITGLAQVYGWRGETDSLEKMEKRIEYDLEYIRNWSLLLDLKVLLLTLVRGFSGKNAF